MGAFPIGAEVNFAILLSKDMTPQAFDLQPTGGGDWGAYHVKGAWGK